jgi:hypothetical protein
MLIDCVTILVVGPVLGWLSRMLYHKTESFLSEREQTPVRYQKSAQIGQSHPKTAMPHILGMSRKHKHGTGRNKGTAHKREINPSNNISGRAGKASKLAPVEPNTDSLPIVIISIRLQSCQVKSSCYTFNSWRNDVICFL